MQPHRAVCFAADLGVAIGTQEAWSPHCEASASFGRPPKPVDICLFELGDPDGEPLPAFEAGSHIDVHLEGGIVRQAPLFDPGNRTHSIACFVRLGRHL